MPEAVPHEEDETRKTRQQLQRLPDSAYDVRGHRTAGRIPDDPAPEVSVEGVSLSASRRGILKAGLGLYLPREIRTAPAHAYAWVDRNTDRIVFGSRPPRRPGNRRVQTGYGKEVLRFSEKYKKEDGTPS